MKMMLINCYVCPEQSRAATNLDNYATDPRLVPVDWTPERSYVNRSIKEISIPRPAPGEQLIFKYKHDSVNSFHIFSIV